MPGQSYLVVDSALSDSVLELATVIDHYNPGTDYVAKVNSFVIESQSQAEEENEDEEEDEDEEVQFDSGLYTELATTTQQYLLAIPDKELEPIANLITYIFSFVPESFETLTKTFLTKLISVLELSASLNKKKYIKSMAVLSILSNLFNFIEVANYDFKNFILEQILKIVEFVQNSDLLQGLNLEELLIAEDGQHGDSKLAKANLIKYSELISQIDEFKSLQALELIINKIDSSDSDIINKYLQNSLNSTTQIDLSNILKSSKITSSSSSSSTTTELISLITKYQQSSPSEFSAVLSSASTKDLNKDLIATKNKYLALSKLAFASKDSIISYADLSSKLSITSTAELEKFIILAIHNKVIQAKLSQSEEHVKVYNTLLISNDLTTGDWTEIKNNLNEWKLKLKDIKSLIDSSRKKVTLKA